MGAHLRGGGVRDGQCQGTRGGLSALWALRAAWAWCSREPTQTNNLCEWTIVQHELMKHVTHSRWSEPLFVTPDVTSQDRHFFAHAVCEAQVFPHPIQCTVGCESSPIGEGAGTQSIAGPRRRA